MQQIDTSRPQDILVEVFDPLRAEMRPSQRLPEMAELGVAGDTGGKVLIVEADPLLRLVLSDALGYAGVGTIAAENGHEALRILGSRSDIAVVLADVTGPEMIDDLDLAWRVAVDHPDVPMVIISALLEPNTVQIPRDALFVRKPFTPDTIVRVVAPLLAGEEVERIAPPV
jgi:CheY-like chemotaxis protein